MQGHIIIPISLSVTQVTINQGGPVVGTVAQEATNHGGGSVPADAAFGGGHLVWDRKWFKSCHHKIH